MDFKNISITKFFDKDFLKLVKLIINTTSNNCPELMIKTFLINVPMIFNVVWKIVKLWIEEKTKNKISIIGKDFEKELLKYVDKDKLPV